MNIDWRHVTWYSKLIAMGLFIALPFIGFWLGIKYDSLRGPLEFSPDKNASSENGQTIPTSTNNIGQLTLERPKSIVAGTIISVDANKEFTFKNMPGVTFRIKTISRISGVKKVPLCAATGQFLYIPNPNDPITTGTCVGEKSLTGNGANLGLVAVDLEIDNQSNTYVNSRFLQIFYNPQGGDDVESKLAPANPNLPAYGTLPHSTRRTVVTFMLPVDQEQIQLVYGDYGKDIGLSETQESLLEKSVSGWIVNFTQKTVSDIPG